MSNHLVSSEPSSVIDKGNIRVDDMSTFVLELEESADRLLKEVLDMPSFGDAVEPHSYEEVSWRQLVPKKKQPAKKPLKEITNSNTSEFLKRVEYFEKLKQNNLQKMHESRETSLDKECRHTPSINPSTLVVKPIQERYPQILKQKEDKVMRIRHQEKIKEEKMYMELTFKPAINIQRDQCNMTFEEFYEEKKRWERKRRDSIQKKKQQQFLQRNKECTFQPALQTKNSQATKNYMRKEGHKRVEDRLHESFERSIQRKERLRTAH